MSNEVPTGWGTELLQGFCAKVTDGTHDTPKKQSTGIPLLTSKNLKNGTLVVDRNYLINEDDANDIDKRSRVDVGDIIFGMIGTIGNPVHVQEINERFVVKNVAIFKLDGLNTKSKWLFQYLNSSLMDQALKAVQTGNAQKFVGLNTLRTTEVPVPPLPEQERIAGVLGSVDAAIVTSEAVITQTARVKQGLLSDLLTKGIGHTKFKQTELGQIPESWEVRPAEDICETVTGYAHNIQDGKLFEYRVFENSVYRVWKAAFLKCHAQRHNFLAMHASNQLCERLVIFNYFANILRKITRAPF